MGFFDFLKRKELKEISELKIQLKRFSSIIDVEAEVERQRKGLEQMLNSKNLEVRVADENFKTLNSKYQVALETYKKLRSEVSLFESKLDLIVITSI